MAQLFLLYTTRVLIIYILCVACSIIEETKVLVRDKRTNTGRKTASLWIIAS